MWAPASHMLIKFSIANGRETIEDARSQESNRNNTKTSFSLSMLLLFNCESFLTKLHNASQSLIYVYTISGTVQNGRTRGIFIYSLTCLNIHYLSLASSYGCFFKPILRCRFERKTAKKKTMSFASWVFRLGQFRFLASPFTVRCYKSFSRAFKKNKTSILFFLKKEAKVLLKMATNLIRTIQAISINQNMGRQWTCYPIAFKYIALGKMKYQTSSWNLFQCKKKLCLHMSIVRYPLSYPATLIIKSS